MGVPGVIILCMFGWPFSSITDDLSSRFLSAITMGIFSRSAQCPEDLSPPLDVKLPDELE